MLHKENPGVCPKGCTASGISRPLVAFFSLVFVFVLLLDSASAKGTQSNKQNEDVQAGLKEGISGSQPAVDFEAHLKPYIQAELVAITEAYNECHRTRNEAEANAEKACAIVGNANWSLIDSYANSKHCASWQKWGFSHDPSTSKNPFKRQCAGKYKSAEACAKHLKQKMGLCRR